MKSRAVILKQTQHSYFFIIISLLVVFWKFKLIYQILWSFLWATKDFFPHMQ